MNIKRIVAAAIVSAGLFIISNNPALASEGQADMRSSIGRCFVSSGFFPDAQYHVHVICGNLLTITSPENLRSIVWITPSNGDIPVKLGEIPYGKGDFKTKTTFSGIFITQERDGSTKTPSSNVVMRGTMRPYSFLDNGNQPTPTDEGEPSQEASPTPTPQRSNILSFLRSGAVLTVIAIFVILLMLILVKPFK